MALISVRLLRPLIKRRRTASQRPVRRLYLERMVFDIKVFRWPDKGDHVIIISRGVIDREGFGRLFNEIGQTTRSLPYCRGWSIWKMPPLDFDPQILWRLLIARKRICGITVLNSR